MVWYKFVLSYFWLKNTRARSELIKFYEMNITPQKHYAEVKVKNSKYE